MSSLSTPTRLGRGLMIPGIDTKPPVDKASTSLSYGGLHTPPQSAHESRRPSLQYSTLSEAPYSAVSTSFHYSQPSTPVHGVDQAAGGFIQRWPESMIMQTSAMSSLPSASPNTHIAEHTLQAAFEAHPVCSNAIVDTTPPYSNMTQTGHRDEYELHVSSTLPSIETWEPSKETANSYGVHNACLGSTLFPTAQGFNGPAYEPIPAFDHLGSSSYHLRPQIETSSIGGLHGYGLARSMYQPPQVVVPSQLSPQDDLSQHHFAHYTSPQHHQDRFSNSFGSSSVSFNDYDVVGPPSPIDAYFAHSEDEEYLMVKAEDRSSPITGPSSCRLAVPNGLPVRSKRRSPRRLRKAGRNAPCHVHDVRGCLVQCEGTQCYLQPLKVEPSKDKKPHRCTLCSAAFDRSEHLKRHLGKHQKEDDRKYPCPLCPKKIGRPDNAGDHFKTHLRPKSKGKRNDHFDWPTLRDAIWSNYDDQKTAKKLVDGLYRWIQAGRPETSGSRRVG